MKLFRTREGVVVEDGGKAGRLEEEWDTLFTRLDLSAHLKEALGKARPVAGFDPGGELLAPVGTQEIWAAGVTYYRSRDARMEEAKDAGGADFYAKVYDADRHDVDVLHSRTRLRPEHRPLLDQENARSILEGLARERHEIFRTTDIEIFSGETSREEVAGRILKALHEYLNVSETDK